MPKSALASAESFGSRTDDLQHTSILSSLMLEKHFSFSSQLSFVFFWLPSLQSRQILLWSSHSNKTQKLQLLDSGQPFFLPTSKQMDQPKKVRIHLHCGEKKLSANIGFLSGNCTCNNKNTPTWNAHGPETKSDLQPNWCELKLSLSGHQCSEGFLMCMVHSHQVREQGGGGVTDTISLEVQHECLKTKHSFIVG